jgi:hypothetical protein
MEIEEEQIDEKAVKEIFAKTAKEADPDDSLRVELQPLLESEKIDNSFLNLNRPGGHLTDDKILLRYQKTVIFSLASSIGSNILHLKSLTNISLPVRIFEPRSYLERFGLLEYFLFAFVYINITLF